MTSEERIVGKMKRKQIILTTLISLLPIIFGLFIWNQLPSEIATHFNSVGEPDAYSSKAFAVFVLPSIFAIVNLFITWVTSHDPKAKNQYGLFKNIVFWICPVMSNIIMLLTFAVALGHDVSVQIIIPVLVGLLFIIIGNYMPKCKQNYTIGIRVPWTLNDEQNWNYTHRIGGYSFMIAGVFMLTSMFFTNLIIVLIGISIAVLVPIIASYLYYKKHKA